MKLKEELLKQFPFLKTKTAKYLILFSVVRKIIVLLFILFYFH